MVSQPACAWNKGLPVEGSVGKGSSLQTLLSQRPHSRRWEQQRPWHPEGLCPSGGRKQGNPLPGCGFPPCQLGFCMIAVIYIIYIFFGFFNISSFFFCFRALFGSFDRSGFKFQANKQNFKRLRNENDRTSMKGVN